MNWFDERVATRYDAGADLNTSLIWIFPAHTEMIGWAARPFLKRKSVILIVQLSIKSLENHSYCHKRENLLRSTVSKAVVPVTRIVTAAFVFSSMHECLVKVFWKLSGRTSSSAILTWLIGRQTTRFGRATLCSIISAQWRACKRTWEKEAT